VVGLLYRLCAYRTAICSEAKISVRQKGLPICRSAGKKHDMQKRVANFDNFEKDDLRGTIFRFCDKGQIPTAKKLALELTAKINIAVLYYHHCTTFWKALDSNTSKK
jgi:hypothetical protein